MHVQAPPAATEPAQVHLEVVAPSGDSRAALFVNLTPPHVHALGALKEAARMQRFDVELQDYGLQGTMVVQIFEHRNAGSCGWVYDVNGVRGDVAADRRPLMVGDQVRWSWDCEG